VVSVLIYRYVFRGEQDGITTAAMAVARSVCRLFHRNVAVFLVVMLISAERRDDEIPDRVSGWGGVSGVSAIVTSRLAEQAEAVWLVSIWSVQAVWHGRFPFVS
jgi:uncharacterized membrane protein YtjA (UPF0391 family)